LSDLIRCPIVRLMTHHIFFSWQMDTDVGVGRNFIERSLERAIGELQADAEVDPVQREDIAIDKDTQNVPGSPPIVETIFGKIDKAAIFISDLTYVATRLDGRRSPNPNVLIEHGWALKSLTWRRVISVMNTAMGHLEQQALPFDLGHFRRPILYACPADADLAARKIAKDGLVRQLKIVLKAILDDNIVQAEMRPPAPTEPHPHDLELLRTVRAQFPTALRRFLAQHDFGADFPRAKLDPIHAACEDWIGAEFEFHDNDLQRPFEAMMAAGRDFREIVLARLHASRRNANIATVKTDIEVEGTREVIAKTVQDLNGRAGKFIEAIDAFDRIARDRIRTAVAHTSPDVEHDAREDVAMAALQELAFDMSRGAFPEIVPIPRLSLRLVPLAAAEGRRLDPRAATAIQAMFPADARERVKTDSDRRQWWACAVPTRRPNLNPETAWRMRLVRPGNFEFQVNIGSRIGDDPEISVDGMALEAQIITTLDRMTAMARELGFDGPALISVVLDGLEDVAIPPPQARTRRLNEREIVFPLVRLHDLAVPVAPDLREGLDMLWQAAGCATGSPSFEGDEWQGYKCAD
jgi:hypothetical protein